MRVAQVGPANARVRAAGVGVLRGVDGREVCDVASAETGAFLGDVDEGGVVTAQDGGGHLVRARARARARARVRVSGQGKELGLGMGTGLRAGGRASETNY